MYVEVLIFINWVILVGILCIAGYQWYILPEPNKQWKEAHNKESILHDGSKSNRRFN